MFVAIHYIEKESVKIFEKDYHALRSAQIFLQIFLFSYFFKEFFKSYFVAGLAIPTFAVIVPLFFFFYKINLINTHIGMILIYIGINIPFNFTFMSAFFEGMSKELDEAARIDGASEMQNLWHIVVPLAKPIMTSVMLIVFVNTWNEFLFSNTF